MDALPDPTATRTDPASTRPIGHALALWMRPKMWVTIVLLSISATALCAPHAPSPHIANPAPIWAFDLEPPTEPVWRRDFVSPGIVGNFETTSSSSFYVVFTPDSGNAVTPTGDALGD